MKHFLKLTLFVALGLATVACEPEDDFPSAGVEGLYAAKAQALAGTWRVTGVTLVDDEATGFGFPTVSPVTGLPVTRQDVTELFGFTEARFTFEVDGAGQPTTFTADLASAPIPVPTSGTWSVDDPTFATEVEVAGASNVTLQIWSVIREARPNQVTVRFARMDEGEAFLSYEYQLTRQ